MTQEQIERELSKLYLELNQKPAKYGLGIYQQINKLEQQYKGLKMSNILQFHSPVFKECEELIKQYQDAQNLLFKARDWQFRKIHRKSYSIFCAAIDLAATLKNKNQQESIKKRLLDIYQNTRAELAARRNHAAN